MGNNNQVISHLALLILFALPGCLAWAIEYKVDGANLSVRTERYEARFEGLRLVYCKSLLTGTVFATPDHPAKVETEWLNYAGGLPGNLKPAPVWTIQGDYALCDGQGADEDVRLTVGFDSATGDLLLWQAVHSRRTGLIAAGWWLDNLSFTGGRLLLPATGGIKLDRDTWLPSRRYEFPTDWASPLAVIEADKGCMAIWAEDITFSVKELFYRRTGDHFGLSFYNRNHPPYQGLDRLFAPPWRMNVFAGDWREPAGRYRQYMEKDLGVRPLTDWTRDVRFEAILLDRAPQKEWLDRLARHVIPERTLVYFVNWRQSEYDTNYPDYTPASGAREFVEHAHQLGFKVHLHTDLPGVSKRNAWYRMLAPYRLVEQFSLKPAGWWLERDEPGSFYFNNPASSLYRKVFVDEAAKGLTVTGADSLHLDVCGFMVDGNGPMEGLTYGQGDAQLHRDLRRRFPGLSLSGESVSEGTLAAGQNFYQCWVRSGYYEPTGEAHPIQTFLYGNYIHAIPWLGFPAPDRTHQAYSDFMLDYERWGVMPGLAVGQEDAAAFDDGLTSAPFSAQMLRVARFFQEHRMEPDFSQDWTREAGVLFKYRGDNGHTATLTEQDGAIRLLLDGDKAYEHVNGQTRVVTDWRTAGQLFGGSGQASGLNPEVTHWFWPSQPAAPGPVTLLNLPPDAFVHESSIGPSGGEISFSREPASGQPLLEAMDLIGGGVELAGQSPTDPPGTATLVTRKKVKCGGVERLALGFDHTMHFGAAAADQPGTGVIRLKGKPGKPILTFYTGLRDGTSSNAIAGRQGGAGATYVILDNGHEFFRVRQQSAAWQRHEVTLPQETQGDTSPTELTLRAEPDLKAGVQWGDLAWGDCALTALAPEQPIAVTLDLAQKPGLVWGLTPNDLTAGRQTLKLNPGRHLGLAFGPFHSVRQSAALLDLPFEMGTIIGGVYTPTRMFSSGEIKEYHCGGAPRRGVRAHPDFQAPNTLRYCLERPAGVTARLTFNAGLQDGAEPSDGVRFHIRINGQDRWAQSVLKPGWQSGSIELAEQDGPKLFIEFLVEPLQSAGYDWAVWGEPTLMIDPPL